MHQSPQKQIGTRRDRNTVYAAFDMADDDDRRVHRVPSARTRTSQWQEDAPRAARAARPHPHPRG